MNGTFNFFGTGSKEYGGHTPIWLGVVAPRPVGGVTGNLSEGDLIPAGTPVNITNKVITPLQMWVVNSYTVGTSSADSTLNIAPLFGSAVPTTSDAVIKVGATFGATGAAAKVKSVQPGADGGWDIKYTHAQLGSMTAGDIIVLSSATADASSGAGVKYIPNGYLYNDIYAGSDGIATGAVVQFHGEGILIDRTPAGYVAAQMAAAVPDVIQING